MNSSPSTTNSSKQRSLSSLHNEYSYLQLQSLSDHDTPKQQKQYQHNYLLGSSEVDSLGPIKMEKEKSQKTVHRFFDEWPPKDKDSWLDLDDKSSKSASVSATGLSISIPSSHDFLPIFSSRTNNGNQFNLLRLFLGVDIYLSLIFVDFLFEPDKYFMSTKLNHFVLQMVDFTLVGFWPKMYLVGVGGSPPSVKRPQNC